LSLETTWQQTFYTYKVVGGRLNTLDRRPPFKFNGMERAGGERLSLRLLWVFGIHPKVFVSPASVCIHTRAPSTLSTTSLPIIIAFVWSHWSLLLQLLLFPSHSHRVERRQRIVLKQAMESTAIVLSLFPEAIARPLCKRAAIIRMACSSGKDHYSCLADGDDGDDGVTIRRSTCFP
jgi:hypothetical protein